MRPRQSNRQLVWLGVVARPPTPDGVTAPLKRLEWMVGGDSHETRGLHPNETGAGFRAAKAASSSLHAHDRSTAAEQEHQACRRCCLPERDPQTARGISPSRLPGDVFLRMDYFTTARNPPTIDKLPKNYLDLMGKPAKGSGIDRPPLLYEDDRRLKALVVHYHLRGLSGKPMVWLARNRSATFWPTPI